MNKRSLALSLLISGFSLFAHQAAAVVPPVDGIGKPANVACKPLVITSTTGAVTQSPIQPVLHFDKIIFEIIGQNGQFPLKPLDPQDADILIKTVPLNTPLDIKVIDNPRTVADLKGKVLTFLGAVSLPAYYPFVRIIDVDYASIVCPK